LPAWLDAVKDTVLAVTLKSFLSPDIDSKTESGARLLERTVPFLINGLILEAEPGPVPCVVVAAIYISPYKEKNIIFIVAALFC
jgi:hypothetical protein